jgi:hypothetical protein
MTVSLLDNRDHCLTSIIPAVMIRSHSQKTSVGIRTPRNQGPQRPRIIVVFLCPSKTQAALCRLDSVMAGCIGQPLKRLAGSLAGSSNLIQSATQRFEPKGGGLSLYQGVTAMAHTQNAPKFQGKITQKPQARFDLFKVVNGVKTLICRDLSSNQATALMPELSADSLYRLKFTGMMEG